LIVGPAAAVIKTRTPRCRVGLPAVERRGQEGGGWKECQTQRGKRVKSEIKVESETQA